MQRSNHERNGRRRRIDGEPWQRNSRDNDVPLFRRRQALRIRCRKVDDQPDHSDGLMGQPPDAKPAHFDEAGEDRRRAHQQPAGGGFDFRTIVGDEPGERQPPGISSRDEAEGEARFAGAGRAANENRARAHEHRRSMDGRLHVGRAGATAQVMN